MAKEIPTTTDIAQVARNWSISLPGQSRGLYALALIDVDFADVAVSRGQTLVGPGGIANPGEFVFDVNPRTLDLEEPMAVTVTPTQDGGQFIENQGMIYKNITLMGTTGLRPNNRSGVKMLPFLGGPNPFSSPNVDPYDNLPRGEESGFEALLRLRNLFRQYADIKRTPAKAHKFLMVWQNGKDGEFYVVEPLVFRTRRASTSPLTSTYEIQLKTISRLDLRVFQDARQDVRRNRTLLQKINERMMEWRTKITNSIARAEALVDRAATVALATATGVTGGAQSVIIAANSLLQSITSSTSAQRFNLVREQVAYLADTASSIYKELQSLTGDYTTTGIITQAAEAAHAYKEIARVAMAVHAEDQLYTQSAAAKYRDRSSAYRSPISGAPRTGGSPTDVSNLVPPSGTSPAYVGNFDTIFSLAQRLLGDSARWKELVMLNNLKAPYVDPTGDGVNVLAPGDTILYPSEGSEDGGSGVSEDLTSARDAFIKRLGRDIKLAQYEAPGGILEMDFAISSRGDLARIEGIPNLEQAIEIKFSTEQGTLPTHPRFGVAAPIGSKALIRTMIGFQLNARACLLADSRISHVNRLNLRLNGNQLNVEAELQIADTDQAVAVSFDARR